MTVSIYNLSPENLKLGLAATSTAQPVYVANKVSVNDGIQKATAFGELQVANLTPVSGWTFAYNINPDLVTEDVTNSGTITHDDNFAVLSTGAATTSSAKLSTILPIRYIPGQGALARFTAIFTEGVAGSTQLIGVGNDIDGFFFGYNGTQFGILRRRNGVDDWTYQADWYNRDTELNNSWINELDYTKGNVFEIQFQWLGFGEQRFLIEDVNKGVFSTVHLIEYSGKYTQTSILNPTLPITAFVENTTNNTDVVLKTPSAMGFCEGLIDNPPPPHPLTLTRTVVSEKIGVVSTEQNIVTLQNASTWHSIDNRIRSQVRNLTIAVDGTKSTIIRIKKNVTLGGTPSFTSYDNDRSPISYDTDGTTVSGGQIISSFVLAKIDSIIIDLASWGIYLSPGETLTVSAQSTASTDVDCAINWVDLI